MEGINIIFVGVQLIEREKKEEGREPQTQTNTNISKGERQKYIRRKEERTAAAEQTTLPPPP